MFCSSKKYIFVMVLPIVIYIFIINQSLKDFHKVSKQVSRNTSISFLSNNFHNNISSPIRTYKILLWTKYFGSDDWQFPDFSELKCEFSNCILTADRNELDTSDAILFHWADINVNDLPNYHLTNQRWILYNWEPPSKYQKEKLEPFNNHIDWTMSYRRDSDIFVPYGRVFKCTRDWKPSYQFNKKNKSIAWMVSNCRAESKRELYVKELQNYIDIDIYGRCGKLKCSYDSWCHDTIARKYKFYLSFENSLCKDYVTEKLFRIVGYDIIPIVFGSADYKQIMPFNSYIDVFNFSSPKDLAEYLKIVSSDESVYNSYFNWKNNYCVEETKQRKIDTSICDLCIKLNSPSKSKYYNKNDLIDWWYKQANCKYLINTVD